MVLPPLTSFILTAPASALTNDPDGWLESCLINGTDLVVLVDGDRYPVRALSLHQLLQIVDASSAVLSSTTERSPAINYLATVQNDQSLNVELELDILSTTLDTRIAVDRVAAAPNRCWVVVDDQQHYQGILDKTRLLAAALTEQPLGASNNDEGDRPSDPQTDKFDIKASESNTALLTYLGHELKTPLTSLLGLSSLLKLGEGGNLSPRQNRYIGLIQQHCRRLANWVNTLIDLGRIESGTLKLIPQMVNLSKVWQEAYHQAALRAGHEDLSAPDLPPPLRSHTHPVTLVADPNRLQQMLSCLMQTALVAQAATERSTFPLQVNPWDDWLSFTIEGLEELLSLDQLSQSALTLPFPVTPRPATPISAEIGHWLEWLLLRKLAQCHRGELVFVVNDAIQICPTLLLPKTPAAASRGNSRLLLVVAPFHLESLSNLWRQAHQLNYQLLITQHLQDAIEIASNLPLSAVLVLIQSGSSESIAELQTLRNALANTTSLTVALVPPTHSALLGQLPVDRELLWPTDRLGGVLLQPSTAMPAPNRLTILYLRSAESGQAGSHKFPNIFHDFGCRVLEVDDLEQASLLRRVWKPDVAVLDPTIANPMLYLENLSRFPELNSLPLITLTMAATQAAHAMPTLSVFPCLVEETSWNTPEAVERLTTWLIQVLQVAATPTA